MIGWLELALVVAVFLFAIRALFTVQCPRGKALIITRGGADDAWDTSPRAFRVLTRGSALQLPWSDTIDAIDLSIMRFDVFVPWRDPPRLRASAWSRRPACTKPSCRPTHWRSCRCRVS